MSGRDSLLDRPVWWLVLRQGLPMAIGMSCHVLFNLVDLVLVGRFGEEAVAGVHVASTVGFLPMIVGNGIGVATMALIAQSLGAGDRGEARTISSWSQAFTLSVGVMLGLALAMIAGPIVDWHGIGGEARTYGYQYLVVSSLGTFSMFALMQCTTTMRALGEAWMPFALLVAANVLNLALNIPMMFGWEALGFAGWGPVGAAWASIIARLLAAGVGYWWIARPNYELRFDGIQWSPPIGVLRRIVDLALPQSVQMLVRVAPVLILTRLAGEMAGQPAIAALGVTTRLDTLVLFASVGFASAATAVAGQNVGAGMARRARRAGWMAGAQAGLFGALVIGILAWYATPLIDLFIVDVGVAVSEAGTGYLRVAAWAHPLAAFCIAATGAINGAGRTLPPMLLDLGGFFLVFVPAGWALVVFWPDAGLGSLWGVVLVTQLALVAGYALYVERGRWTRGVRAARLAG